MKTLGLFLIAFLFSNTLWNAQETENLLCNNPVVQEELVIACDPPAQPPHIFPVGKLFAMTSDYYFSVSKSPSETVEWECISGGIIDQTTENGVWIRTVTLYPPLYLPVMFRVRVRIGNECGWSAWRESRGVVDINAPGNNI